jgi:hypothetical protein
MPIYYSYCIHEDTFAACEYNSFAYYKWAPSGFLRMASWRYGSATDGTSLKIWSHSQAPRRSEHKDMCYAGYVIHREIIVMKAVIDRIEGGLSVLSVGDDSIKLNIALSAPDVKVKNV